MQNLFDLSHSEDDQSENQLGTENSSLKSPPEQLQEQQINFQQQSLQMLPSEHQVTPISVTEVLQAVQNQKSAFETIVFSDQSNKVRNVPHQTSQVSDPKTVNTMEQVEFKQILDVITELKKKNWIPTLICLRQREDLITQKDSESYTLLHHSVSIGCMELTRYLIQHNVDPNVSNDLNQTPILMASNYGEIECFHYLIINGADYHIKDQFCFSSLLYSLKEDNMVIFYYLLYLGANINDYDQQQSGIGHWGGYKNNPFLIKFLHSIGFDLRTKDIQGFCALERSMLGNSYKAVRFLARQYPQTIPPLETIQIQTSPSIQEMLLVNSGRKQALNWVQSLYEKKRKLLLPLIQFTFIFAQFICVYLVSWQDEQKNSSRWLYYFFYIFTLYFLFFSHWFLFRIGDCRDIRLSYLIQDEIVNRKQRLQIIKRSRVPEYIQSIRPSHLLTKMDFKHVDKLLAKDEEELVISFDKSANKSSDNSSETIENLTFLHHIAMLFEQKMYNELKHFYFNNYCPHCKTYKPPKTKHSRLANKCVPDYSHYSFFYGRIFNSNNHLMYLVMIFLQNLFSWLFMIIVVWPKFQALDQYSYVSVPVKVGYAFFLDGELLQGICYFLNWVIIYVTSMVILIEFQAISQGLTRNELLNDHKYRYLFTVGPNDHGNLVLKRKSPWMSPGLVSNFLTYLSNQMLHMKSKCS